MLTLIHVFQALFVLLFGAAGAAFGAREGPWAGLGGVLGIIAGITILWLLGREWRPFLPRCATGRCEAHDYRWLGSIVDGRLEPAPHPDTAPHNASSTPVLFNVPTSGDASAIRDTSAIHDASAIIDAADIHDGSVYQCRCGDMYILSPPRLLRGRRLRLVEPEGTPMRFRRFRPLGPWVPD